MKNIFKSARKLWMAFAHAVGWFNTRLLLTILYVFIIGLPAIFLKLFRKDLLDRAMEDRPSYWVEKEKIEHTLEGAKHQF